MGQHHPLRIAGRAGGEDQRGERVRALPSDQLGEVGVLHLELREREDLLERPQLRLQPGCRQAARQRVPLLVGQIVADEDPLRARRPRQIHQLGGGRFVADRDGGRARLQDPEVGHRPLGCVLGEQHHPVVRGHLRGQEEDADPGGEHGQEA